MKAKRAIVFELNKLTEEQEIILGYLTYHAGRLYNQANYFIKNKLAKPYMQTYITSSKTLPYTYVPYNSVLLR